VLREPKHRLRKAGIERLKNGGIAANPQRLGPLTFAARHWALSEILLIQYEINAAAAMQDRPKINLLNPSEESRIRELIDLQTWPDGWSGNEPVGDVPLDKVLPDGSVLPLLF
jgi:DNA sulfur modification protein DndC